MISFLSGDLLEDDADVLVNTVNCVGIMGSGIALQFKKEYPLNFLRYQQRCRSRLIKPHSISKYQERGKIIYNLATKDHWRDPTRLSWIASGCRELSKVIREDGVKSIAIPALGCNNGGANWNQVRNLLQKHLQGLDCDIRLYLPQEVDL